MGTTSLPADQVMYHNTVRKLPLQERLRAASLAKCASLTMESRHYFHLLSTGVSTKDILAMADDAGVRIDHLDPFCRWLPKWEPDLQGLPLTMFNSEEDDFFRIVDALAIRSVSIVGVFPEGVNELNELIDNFGAFCLRAAAHDLRCDLEFIPFWGIPDLEMAWEIVRAVNAPNSGILLDFWHYTRSHSKDELLRAIPGRWITGVQVDDGDAELAPGVDMVDDTVNRRVPPGEGGFRVREIVSILREIGGLNRCGPEIISAAFDTMSAEEIAAKCRESMSWALTE